MNSLDIDISHQDKKCETVASLPMRISTPVTVVPHIRQLPANISCCGEPTLTPISSCRGGICSFVITQYLCVEIPIEIGATANIGKPQSQCVIPTREGVENNYYPNSSIIPKPNRIEPHWSSPKIRF